MLEGQKGALELRNGVLEFGDVYVLDCADNAIEVSLDFLPLMLLIRASFWHRGYLAQ
jgi:hypothetical protein